MALLPVALAGCGDRIATRQIFITQQGMAVTQWDIPIALDTSHVPDASVERTDSRDADGNPVTHLTFSTGQPIKLVLVPATSP
ncbi:MAG TPA: hypothetical protein VH253_14540 [Phycisphaerae bacterium]|nr:hypothetical protein [Phycisphaerae bacterium]